MERVKEFRVPLFVAAGALVVVAAVYLLWISPEGKKVSDLGVKQTQLQEQQATLQNELIMLKRESEDLGTTCATLTKYVTEVPRAPEVDSFLQQLTQLAVASGDPNTPSVSVTEAGDSKTPAGTTPVAVSLELAGNYGQMSSFLTGLYSFPRLFTVNTMSISAGGAVVGSPSPVAPPPGAGSGSYNLTLTGNIYYAVGEQNVCAQPQPK